MVIPTGRTASAEFYIFGLAGSGTVTYSATAAGFGSVNATATLAPSGFVLLGPAGIGQNFSTTIALGNRNLEVISAVLDGTGSPVDFQELAGGLSANVQVNSSNTNAGTITTSPVAFAAGVGNVVTQFHPVAAGSTTLSATAPAGYSTPAGASMVATVQTSQLLLCAFDIGQHLQQPCNLILSAAAPAGGLPVTITSGNANLLRFSPSQTAAGSGSITITVPAGELSTTFYGQALGNLGTVSYTASAPGYVQTTGSANLYPSGVVISGPFGFVPFPFQPSKAAGPAPVTVYTAILDPSTNALIQPQELAGGSSLSVSLTMPPSPPGVGTIQSPVTITGGADRVNATFTPLLENQITSISVSKPPNFAQPSNFTTLTVQVLP
jgi:hypothetical protein